MTLLEVLFFEICPNGEVSSRIPKILWTEAIDRPGEF